MTSIYLVIFDNSYRLSSQSASCDLLRFTVWFLRFVLNMEIMTNTWTLTLPPIFLHIYFNKSRKPGLELEA